MNLDKHTKLGGQRKFPDTIQTEIPVADILALYDNQIVYGRFMFICYAIAHLMNEKLKMMPEWDGSENTFSSAYDGVTMHYCTSRTNPMSDQVNAQCFAFMERLGLPVVRSKWETLGDFFLDRQCATFILSTGEKFEIPSWSHDFRHQLLQSIMKIDPDAVFTINLTAHPHQCSMDVENEG